MSGRVDSPNGERPDPRSVIVAGGGILGCLTSLLLVEAGCAVTLVEHNDELWRSTSSVGEGKIHLGLVYAKGSVSTRSGMLRAAIEFAPLVERALGHVVDWAAITSEPFDYLVMPDSLMSTDELAAVYRTVDDEHAVLGRPHYLGQPIDRLAAHAAHTDNTGLPAFATAERAIDPEALRALVVAAIEARASHLTVITGTSVTGIDQHDAGVMVTVTAPGADLGASGPSTLEAASVVDARWQWQGHNVRGVQVGPRNLRVKSTLLLDRDASTRTVTMALGPYGDVVGRRDSVYASWYPAARLAHEHRAFPSPQLLATLDQAVSGEAATAQRQALVELGLLEPTSHVHSVRAGVIIGDGTLDIDAPGSGLHDRHGADVTLVGRIALPRSLKLTTAPSAARDTAAAVANLLALQLQGA